MASTPLRQFGTASSQTFTRANQMTNNLTAHNRVLGQSYNELQARIRQVENTIRTSTIPSQILAARRELEALQRQANRHPGRIGGVPSGGTAPAGSSGGGLMGLLGSIGGLKGLIATAGLGMAIKSIVSSTSSFISESINKGLERQQIQTSFNVLAGNDIAGKALTNQLVDLQKNTILGSEVFQNAQTMLGFGFKSNEVYENLKMLGDVSMGDAQKLGSLTLAFSQIRAGGKLTGQDLLQLINAGFNPLESMALKTGKSVAVLKDEMSKGLITFGMVQQAFKDATSEGGRFENMLGKIAETPAGKLQQLSGAWQEFKIQAGAALMPLVSMALDLAQKVLPIIEGIIKPLTSGVQHIAGLINGVTGETSNWGYYASHIKDLFGNYILPYVAEIWKTVTHIVAKMTEFAGKSELVKDIFNGIVLNLKAGFIVLEIMMKQAMFFFDTLIMPMLRVAEALYNIAKNLSFGKLPDLAKKDVYIDVLAPPEKKEQKSTKEILDDIAKNTAGNAVAAKANESTISGGGQKIVNISVSKFLDNINISTMSMQEGVADVERIFLEMFSRVVTQGAS